MLKFTLTDKDKKARLGKIETPHSVIETPVFMPVGTAGAVKAILNKDVSNIGYNIILGNTYHLYLRPGMNVLKKFDGLHNFMNWKRSILTDSGGFQIYSLSKLNKIDQTGYYFSSHIDGSKHHFTPEKVIDIQNIIGSDIMMPLDYLVPFNSSEDKIKKSVEITIKWAKQAREYYEKTGKGSLFGIVQGAGNKKQREICAEQLVKLNFSGYSIGGLSVGEEKKSMYKFTEFTAGLLPEDKPRYLMGVGSPEDLLTGVKFGVDMFDCVYPTRNARNATAYTYNGKVLLRNKEHEKDDSPIDDTCDCYTCQNHTKGYLRHLFKAKEFNAYILTTIHNLFFFNRLMKDIRTAIKNKNYEDFYNKFINKVSGKYQK